MTGELAGPRGALTLAIARSRSSRLAGHRWCRAGRYHRSTARYAHPATRLPQGSGGSACGAGAGPRTSGNRSHRPGSTHRSRRGGCAADRPWAAAVCAAPIARQPSSAAESSPWTTSARGAPAASRRPSAAASRSADRRLLLERPRLRDTSPDGPSCR